VTLQFICIRKEQGFDSLSVGAKIMLIALADQKAEKKRRVLMKNCHVGTVQHVLSLGQGEKLNGMRLGSRVQWGLGWVN